ncbi:MAG TPA: 16S rRNA (guanine(527)-N(7))-methyltransferase RsmG [Jatrophihabitans sp.]|nr:16S rRNA (guanine(527)-N(7))-methyltransferase RsmG [Jatrophihabitans sp.]
MTESHQQAEPEAPAPPAVVFEAFTEAAPTLIRYAGWLAGAGTVRGLIGPREVPRLWDRHVLNSVALAELLPAGIRIVDIGTGAGLPGLAVAIVRPDLRVDLVESLRRRTDFLSEVVADLDLRDRVRVVRGRAEEPAVVQTVGHADVVTARAVAPLDKLVRWSFPLLAPGGRLMAMKGSAAADEVAAQAAALRKAKAVVERIVECGVDLVDPPARAVVISRR